MYIHTYVKKRRMDVYMFTDLCMFAGLSTQVPLRCLMCVYGMYMHLNTNRNVCIGMCACKFYIYVYTYILLEICGLRGVTSTLRF